MPSASFSFDHSYRCVDRGEFLSMVTHLATCHGHRFAVHVDDLDIFGSEMAMECLKEFKNQEIEVYNDLEDFFFSFFDKWFTLHTNTRRRDMPNNWALDLRRLFEHYGYRIVPTPQVIPAPELLVVKHERSAQ